jgi:DNA-binding beta-propeller fold protein YncE
MLLLLVTGIVAVAQVFGGDIKDDDRDSTIERASPRTRVIYETNFRSSTIQAFNLTGSYLGIFARPIQPTGIIFDDAGNLYVCSDNDPESSILKFTPDGTGSVFANSGLDGPHGLAFDDAGNLYVANAKNNTVIKFNSDGVGSIFADRTDGLMHPFDLVFDGSGNLYVSNAHGGPARKGSIFKFTPDGVGSLFADTGLQTPFGLAFDQGGNLYVSNVDSDTIEKFAPDGTDLGVFASTGLNEPLGIMFDAAGNLYAANKGNDIIEEFAPDGTDLGVFAHTDPRPHFLKMFTPGNLHIAKKEFKSARK